MAEKSKANELAAQPRTGFGPVGIIGLGLIGGSLAKAFARKADIQVVGLTRSKQVIDTALAEHVLVRGAVLPDLPLKPGSSEPLDPDSPDYPAFSQSDEAAWRLLADCEAVFVCTPPASVPAYVKIAARYCPGILSDVASVKQPVMEQVKIDRFIGGHPMAGSEKAGYIHASELILDNAVYALCLQPHSRLPAGAVRRFEQLVRLCGAKPFLIGATEHDRAVAAVSHLPHVAASGLALLAAQQDQGSLARMAAGGFRDITRIASSDASLWADIALENRSELLPVLDRYIGLLQDFRRELADSDEAALQRFFLQGAQYRNALPAPGRGAQ